MSFAKEIEIKFRREGVCLSSTPELRNAGQKTPPSFIPWYVF
jgi:hypothetical protein